MTEQHTQLWQDIQSDLSAQIHANVQISEITRVSGGDINQSFILKTDAKRYFAKINSAYQERIFHAEAAALKRIAGGLNSDASSPCKNVPSPLCIGSSGEHSYLILEYIELIPSSNTSSTSLGELVAKLHSIHKAPDNTTGPYGWYHNNFIGTTPQANHWSANWATFFIENRLKPQIKSAGANGFSRHISPLVQGLLDATQTLLANHNPKPALLHGDLWAGNAGCNAIGQPVIFDPASYYGDKETDIAMTKLFGGFDTSFYQAYHQHHPLIDGHEKRADIYNLYHLLNHLNLFGETYLAQVVRTIKNITL